MKNPNHKMISVSLVYSEWLDIFRGLNIALGDFEKEPLLPSEKIILMMDIRKSKEKLLQLVASKISNKRT